MRTDLTVIYYTAHTEDPVFEEKIKADLIKKIGDLPLISVSQKPIDFGENICVGEVGVSVRNAWRQFQIGAKEAKTRFVCSAESDYLYAPDRFDFVPERDDAFYIPSPMYMIQRSHSDRLFIHKPKGCEGCVTSNREYLINRIEEMYFHEEVWGEDLAKVQLIEKGGVVRFETKTSTVMIRTEKGLTQKLSNIGDSVSDLPFWGSAQRMVEEYS